MEGKLKSVCDSCERAKVKCSGPPGPCERCGGWRGLPCVFRDERKRGRPRSCCAPNTTTSCPRSGNETLEGIGKSKQVHRAEHGNDTCEGSTCWLKLSSPDAATAELYGENLPRLEGLPLEHKRIVQIFLALYKHHTVNRSCETWFSRQLNKIVTMLGQGKHTDTLLGFIEWMNRNKLMVAPVRDSESTSPGQPDDDEFSWISFADLAFSDELGGLLDFSLPRVRTTSNCDTGREICSREVSGCACIRIEYSRGEICSITTSEDFAELFGWDTVFFTKYIDGLYRGILPWGCDIFSIIFAEMNDVILLIRMLTYKYVGLSGQRMKSSPPYEVRSTHFFPCVTSRGSRIDCLIHMAQVQESSDCDGVDMHLTASFEPYTQSKATASCLNGSVPKPV